MTNKKIQETYQKLETNILKDLAKSFEDMEKENLPYLLAELTARGELSFVEEIETQIEDQKTSIALKYKPDSQLGNQNSDGFLLDDEEVIYSENLISDCFEYLYKRRKDISSWEESKDKIKQKFNITLDTAHEIALRERLNKKKQNLNKFGLFIILFWLALAFVVFLGTEGSIFFVDGILFFIIACTFFARAVNINQLIRED